MHQGNWKCSACGGAITELPFVPRSETGLTCRTCWAKSKDASSEAPAEDTGNAAEEMTDLPPLDAVVAGEQASAPAEELEGTPVPPGEKPKFTGDWKCSICGGAITSLPFQPRSTDGLKCIDCFKKG